MGGREGAALRELSGLQFYNQRQSVEGRRPPSSSLLRRHHACIISSSSTSGSGVSLFPHGQARTVMALWK